MLFTELKGRKVVSTDTASTVGVIADYVVDPHLPGVVAFTLAKTPGAGNVLPWANVIAVGLDAVTVSSADAIITPDERVAELSGKSHALPGKRVLSAAGIQLGIVNDVDFDSSSGQLTALNLDTGPIDPAGLLGIGSYAAVVQAPPPGE